MSENKQTTDSELLLQLIGYNQNAFEEIYNRYSATIYSLVKEIVTNPKLAEKILLNVFSVFLKRIDQYSTTSNNIFTWLTLLARNISIDTLKRMKFVEDIPIYSDDYEIEFIVPNLSQEISTINLSERETLSEKIKLYKDHLTEIQNLVLSLIYFEGLNEEEIAKRLNVAVATVRQKTLAIMENLHQQYTGRTENINSNKELLSLIKLESLGCLSSEEIVLFNQIRNNDPDFLWKEYGEYQNLTALISTAITLTKPLHDLNTELKSVFSKILQGSDVDYPIVASEISIVEPAITPTPEPLPEKIIVPEIKEKVEVKVEKDAGFQIKFRERDPNELSLLRKLETVEVKSTPAPVPVYAKVEKEIQFRDNRVEAKMPGVLTDRKDSALDNKEIIKAVITENKIVQNKIQPAEAKKPDIEIENDDPLIIIEEPKPIMVKEESIIKNRLIPNSSINLREIFKKEAKSFSSNENNLVNSKSENVIHNKVVDPVIQKSDIKISESPGELQKSVNIGLKEEKKVQSNLAIPVVEKSDIKIKTNEPPKEFRKSIFVDKTANPVEQKPMVSVVEKIGLENKKIENTVLKEEKIIPNKQVEPAVEKTDIKIKTNEPPKEFRKSSIFVDKTANPVGQKPTVSVVEKIGLENKKIESTVLKEEKIIPNKQIEPAVEKTDIKIKTNEPPKEFRKSIFVEKDIKPVQSKQNVPVIDKQEIKNKQIEASTEIRKAIPVAAKEQLISPANIQAKGTEKPEIQVKTNQVPKEIQKVISEGNNLKVTQPAAKMPSSEKHEVKLRPAETAVPKQETIPNIKKAENSFERIKPAVDRTNLKIRETVFVETDKKSEVSKQPIIAQTETKPENETFHLPKSLTESINIDEILTKIEDDKSDAEELTPAALYERRNSRLQKKANWKVLTIAAVFVIVAFSSIYVYMSFQNNSTNLSVASNKSEKLIFAGQSNLIQSSDINTKSEIGNNEQIIETTPSQERLTDKKIEMPPLPEISTKEESTLFASNVNNDLTSLDEKQPNQIAAAKTETTTPPKENKVKDEEPAFFVAVEEMPELVGGLKTLQGKIKYPEIAKRVGVEGKVIVQALVDETGNVISVNTIKGIGSGCDEVAMDAVRNSKFTPGKQRGKNVKVQVTIPIVFKK